MFSASDIERFWSKVDRRGADECWPWMAGYRKEIGHFCAQRRSWGSPRVALSINLGRLVNAPQVCHRCDNPACCNPAHLFEGTALVNNRDARDKGRYANRDAHRSPETYIHGEAHHKAKLTELEVRDIKDKFANGHTIMQIRDNYYPWVTWENVSAIVKNKTWRHLNQPPTPSV